MLKERKEKYLRVRMTAEDLQILQEVSQENGISLSKYIRMILDQAILEIETARANRNENE